MGEREPGETPELPKIIDVGDIPAGETTEKVDAVEPEIITTADIPTGEGEVVDPGPKHVLPEQPTPDRASVEQARADVKAVTNTASAPPPAHDAQGYNVTADGYKSNRVNPDQQKAGADAYLASQGLPTSGEKAAMPADQSKSGLRKFWDRLRGK